MKYKAPQVAAIFLMTSFNRDRGGMPRLDPHLHLHLKPIGTANLWEFLVASVSKLVYKIEKAERKWS